MTEVSGIYEFDETATADECRYNEKGRQGAVIRNHGERIKRLENLIRTLKETFSTQQYEILKRRHAELSEAYQALFAKVVVSTEIRQFALHGTTPEAKRPMLYSLAIEVFELDDDQVMKFQNMPVPEIIQRMTRGRK